MGLYGSGGHYLPHFDAFDKAVMPPDQHWENIWVGNRYKIYHYLYVDVQQWQKELNILFCSITPTNILVNYKKPATVLESACPNLSLSLKVKFERDLTEIIKVKEKK